MSLTSPYTSRSQSDQCSLRYTWQHYREAEWRTVGSSRNTRINLAWNALLPVRPTSPSDARGRRQGSAACNVDGRQFWRVGNCAQSRGCQGCLKTVHATIWPCALAPRLSPSSEGQGERRSPFLLCSSLITSAPIVAGLEIEYSLPFRFDCFRKLRLLFGRKVFPGYLVGVPSTEVKLSMQWARNGRRNRKRSVFLAFADVEVPSRLPWLLNSHCSFLLWSASIVRVGRVASSFCTLPKVLPRSCSSRVALQSDYHLQQLHSPVVARTNLFRKE